MMRCRTTYLMAIQEVCSSETELLCVVVRNDWSRGNVEEEGQEEEGQEEAMMLRGHMIPSRGMLLAGKHAWGVQYPEHRHPARYRRWERTAN